MDQKKTFKNFIHVLEERAKELNCLYRVEDLLNSSDSSLEDVALGIIRAIPPGWQYPAYCLSRIIIGDREFTLPGFKETVWKMDSEINVQDEPVGKIEIFYTIEFPVSDEGPFLKEERKLIDTVADRFGHYILHQRLKSVFDDLQLQKTDTIEKPRPEWAVILDLLRKTDQHLSSIIARKMINLLFYRGVPKSKELFKKLGSIDYEGSSMAEVNRPSKKQILENSFNLSFEIFNLAAGELAEDEILDSIQKWINEEKSSFLVMALANRNTPLSDIADAIRRYHHISPDTDEENPTAVGIRVSLIRRFLTEQLAYINIAKNYSEMDDFYSLLQNIIFSPDSHGKLGGKSAGVFLANKILENYGKTKDNKFIVKTPKTWYLTSDGIMNFVYYNSLEDAIEHKYKEIDEIRREYPFIIQAFKNSHFSPDIINGLSRALDDFGNSPIIVRSSSLLEDRMGSAFAGKYKSLFLANQGSKTDRLDALTDAIAEVYASTFSPDPIGYRIERGLLDFHEEMGIMIQEVVGTKVGKYFFPSFAGVAFSNNEFRWSPRILREDGLIRIVPGLGTRAVDRIGDDYPVMIAPGKPSLRVNLSYDEIAGYSPKNMDVINLETNSFETIPIKQLVNEIGNNFPMLNEIFSILDDRQIKNPVGLGIDTKKHEVVVTFENLFLHTPYLNRIHTILKILSQSLKVPVDIEFACNGKDIYLLQCRPQSSGSESVAAIIPKEMAKERIVFTANKYISNGKVPGIDYLVYVEPEKYAELENLENLKSIGYAVGKLNKVLPKKRFILMGPGRWGSRGDIRLGVSVTYADINNTAMLIEIARSKGNYVPDLSFGTHFFQDLVESGIRYLPLYPDEKGIIFNEEIMKKHNSLPDILPEYAQFNDVIKVINIPETTGGMILRILLNADDEEAVGYLTDPSTRTFYNSSNITKADVNFNEPWQMRTRIAENIASKLDGQKYGVKSIYLFGTTFIKTATMNADVDLAVHFVGTEEQKMLLNQWFKGWNDSLADINYYQTGIRTEKFIDVFYITDEDIKDKTFYSELVNTSNNKSRLLQMYF